MATDIRSRTLRRTPGSRFDSWATSYDRCSLQPAYRAAHESLMTIAARLTPTPQRILDLGCGTGHLLQALHSTMPSATVVGVDASLPMLHIAATHRPDLAWVGASAERLPFADASFDLVTASFTARHWRDVRQATREAARILTPGGMLAIADAFGHRPPGALAALWRRTPSIPEPLQTALPEAGLRSPTTWTTDGYGPIPTITVITVTAA